MRRIAIAVCTALVSFAANAGDRITGKDFATRSEVIAQHGMVATSHPLATQVGLDVLKKGGNAIDAAIAANAALGLMEPVSNGVGGDLFAIVWDAKTKKLYGYNGSGRSPKSLSLKWFQDNGYKEIPALGPLPVSVPGCVDGWFALHDRFGKLSMKDDLAPAIRYAREGFPLTELIAFYWKLSGRAPLEISRLQGADDDRWPRAGEGRDLEERESRHDARSDREWRPRRVLQRQDRAHDRRLHEGERRLSSYEDMASHHGEWVEPVSTNYRGYEVFELPPNGQGIATLQMLNILEGYDFSKIPFGSTEHVHLLVEAKKLAYEDRAKYYADPDFAKAPVARLISKDYAAERRKLIRADHALDTIEPGDIALGGDTIYMTTADQWGNMVSLIQSNFRGMGSGMTPPGLGFVLQDRGELFVLKDGHANTFQPGKRPFHTIIPAFVTKDGAPWLSFGVMGGDMQPQGHVEILMNLIDFGMNLQEAGDAPRIQHEGSTSPEGQAEPMTRGGWVELESGFPYETVRGLMVKGHDVRFTLGQYGGFQGIEWDARNHVYIGASEGRKDGQAAGY